MSSRPEEVNYNLAHFAADAIDDRAKLLRSRLKKVKKSDDPEAIHQARVAGRRLREALSLARVVAPDLPQKAERGAREVTRTFSELRTRDSLTLLLGSMPLPPSAECAKRYMLRYLEKRKKLLARGREAIQKKRIRRLFLRARALTRRLRALAPEDAPHTRSHFVSLASEFIGPRRAPRRSIEGASSSRSYATPGRSCARRCPRSPLWSSASGWRRCRSWAGATMIWIFCERRQAGDAKRPKQSCRAP